MKPPWLLYKVNRESWFNASQKHLLQHKERNLNLLAVVPLFLVTGFSVCRTRQPLSCSCTLLSDSQAHTLTAIWGFLPEQKEKKHFLPLYVTLTHTRMFITLCNSSASGQQWWQREGGPSSLFYLTMDGNSCKHVTVRVVRYSSTGRHLLSWYFFLDYKILEGVYFSYMHTHM